MLDTSARHLSNVDRGDLRIQLWVSSQHLRIIVVRDFSHLDGNEKLALHYVLSSGQKTHKFKVTKNCDIFLFRYAQEDGTKRYSSSTPHEHFCMTQSELVKEGVCI